MSKSYSTELEFVEKLAGRYNLTENGNHATTIIYSNSAQINIPLKEGKDQKVFADKLQQTPFLGTDTRFERGLYMARQALMDPKHGGRSKVPKLLFVMTDGRHSDPNAGSTVADMAAELKALGVHVFAVVIGDAYEEAEIMKMVSTNTSVYYTSNMLDITHPNTLDLIMKLTCPHLGPSRPVKPDGDGGIISPGGLTDGTIMVCPVDKNIKTMKHMMKQGVSPEWISKFYASMGGLHKMIKYYKDLKKIFEYLPSSMTEGGQSAMRPSTMQTCKPTSVKAAVDRLFCEDDAKDMFAIARENGGGLFVDLLWASGLANEMLQSGEEYTLIVPTDKCFKQVSKSMRTKMADNCFLRKLLSFHIAKRDKSSTSITTASKHLKSLHQGRFIFYSKLGQTSMYGGSTVQKPNMRSRNGDVIIVDNFMTVPQSTVTSILTQAQKYTTVTQQLQQPTLARELNALGAYTLFVCDDTQMAAKLAQGQDAQQLVRDHIVKGVYFARMFVNDGSPVTLKSITGKDIVVLKQGSSYTVNGVAVQQSDIRATNGVVHVLAQPMTN